MDTRTCKICRKPESKERGSFNILLQCSNCKLHWHHRCCTPPIADPELFSLFRKGKGLSQAAWRCQDCKGPSRSTSMQTMEPVLDSEIDLTDEPLEKPRFVPRQPDNIARTTSLPRVGPSKEAVELLSSDDDIQISETAPKLKPAPNPSQLLINKPSIGLYSDSISKPDDVPVQPRPRKKLFVGQDKEPSFMQVPTHEDVEHEDHLSELVQNPTNTPSVKIVSFQPPLSTTPQSPHEQPEDTTPDSPDSDSDSDLVPRLERLTIRRMTPAPTRTRTARPLIKEQPGLTSTSTSTRTTTQDSAPVPLLDFGLVKLAYDGKLENRSSSVSVSGFDVDMRATASDKLRGRTKIKAKHLEPTSRFALRSTWESNIVHISEDDIEELGIVANLHDPRFKPKPPPIGGPFAHYFI